MVSWLEQFYLIRSSMFHQRLDIPYKRGKKSESGDF